MKGRALAVNAGLVVVASMHLWCSSSSEVVSSDAGPEAGEPSDAAAPPDADAAVVPTCTSAFCRVPFPGGDDVILALWARSATEVWGVGLLGFAVNYDGKDWRRVPTGTKAGIFGVVGTPDGTVFGASTGQEILQLNRETDGGVEPFDAGFTAKIDAIAGRDAELVAVGVMLRNFSQDRPPPDNIWRYGASPEGGAPSWTAISPSCPMGEGGEPRCQRLRAVWIESADRSWFAGDDGKVFRTKARRAGDPKDRIQLEEMNSGSLRRFNAMWGFSGDDVWAVGVQGVIRHWNGSAWMTVDSPITSELYGLWGSRPDDLWAVGDDGAVLHWDGKAFTLAEIPFAPDKRPRLYAVTGGGSDVWIAGEGTLLRSAPAGSGQ